MSARTRLATFALAVAAWSIASDVHAVREADMTELVNKILDCRALEGDRGAPTDRDALVAMTTTDGGRALLDAACPGLPESCAATISAMRCDDLARHLVRAMPAAPKWASTLGGAVGARTSECIREERHDAPGGEPLNARARAFGDRLATTLGALVTSGACEVHVEALDACVASLKARPCDAFANDLLSLDDPSLVVAPTTEAAADGSASPRVDPRALRLCPALFACAGERPHVRFHRADADATNADGAATPGAR